MKKIGFYLALTALVVIVGACTAPVDSSDTATVNDGTFEIVIRTEKEAYKADEAVQCWATLEYVGDADSITMYSGDPLVYFTITGGPFTGDYAINDILMSTTLKKGEPLRFEFTKSGGYSSDDEDAAFWESWYAEPELRLAAGEYTVAATVDGSFDENDVMGTAYTLTASKKLTVTP